MNALDEMPPGSLAARIEGCTCDEATASWYATLIGSTAPQHDPRCPLVDVEQPIAVGEC